MSLKKREKSEDFLSFLPSISVSSISPSHTQPQSILLIPPTFLFYHSPFNPLNTHRTPPKMIFFQSPYEPTAAAKPAPYCAFPNCKVPRTKTCSRCKETQCCSKEHQVERWRFHKKICVAPQKSQLPFLPLFPFLSGRGGLIRGFMRYLPRARPRHEDAPLRPFHDLQGLHIGAHGPISALPDLP